MLFFLLWWRRGQGCYTSPHRALHLKFSTQLEARQHRVTPRCVARGNALLLGSPNANKILIGLLAGCRVGNSFGNQLFERRTHFVICRTKTTHIDVLEFKKAVVTEWVSGADMRRLMRSVGSTYAFLYVPDAHCPRLTTRHSCKFLILVVLILVVVIA
jgi:hypothetical protein